MKQRILFSTLFAAVISILMSQTYSNLNIAKVWANKTGRIDIYAIGKNTKVEVLRNKSDIDTTYTPNWCKKDGEMCATTDFELHGGSQKYNLTFIAHGTGRASVRFMGPDVRVDNIRKPVPVDYEKIHINGREISIPRKTVWHDSRFVHTFDIKDKDVVTISFVAAKHRYHFSDLGKIYGGSWLMFISSYILAFAIFFKLLGMKNKITANSLFVVLLFCMMWMPMLNISHAEKSETENRMLATKPVMLDDKGFNLKYGERYDAWFNDRFAGREMLLSLHTGTEKHFNRYLRNKTAIMDTKTNWCFGADFKPFRHSDASAALAGLNALNDFARANKAKFYVMIVPDKLDVYNQYNPFVKRFPDFMYNQDIKYLQEKASFPIIFPINELRDAAKSDFVFFKTDHHWTEYGAYHSYRALMQRIKKDFPRVPIVSENDYNIFYNRHVRGDWDRGFGAGQTYNALHVEMPEDKLLDTDYRYYNPKKELVPDAKHISLYKTKHYKNNGGRGQYRVLLTGTSMNENLLQFLPYSFRELKYFRLNGVKDVKPQDGFKILRRYADDFKKYHPDIIILVVTSLNIDSLKNIAK